MNRIELEALLPDGYVLVSPETGNRATALTLKCPQGHLWPRARIGNISNGTQCPECHKGVRYRLSYDDVKQRCEADGWLLLSPTYNNAHEKLHIQCKQCGAERHAQLTNIYSRCNECRKEIRTGGCLTKLRSVIADRGHILLNDPDLSEGRIRDAKLRVQCHQGHIYENSYQGIVLKAQNCGYCEQNRPLSIELITQWLDPGYTVSGEYINNTSTLQFTCSNRHTYEAPWSRYQKGYRCPECHGVTKLDDEEVQRRLDGHQLKWLDGHYHNVRSILMVKCANEKHAPFPLKFQNLYDDGLKCPECKQQFSSKAEREIADWLESLDYEVVRNNRTLLVNGREIDIYLPDKALAIEYTGLFYHQEGSAGQGKDRNYHANKYAELAARNIQLLTVFEDEWRDKNTITRSLILSKLNKADTILHARKCDVRRVSKREFQQFLGTYHLQGQASQNTMNCWGLYYNELLVQCMTYNFGHRQNMDQTVMYIDRLCTAANTIIIGGASRLLKTVKEHVAALGRSGLRTYSDRRYSDGDLYQTLGFTHVGILPPDYTYVKNGKRHSKQSLKLSESDKLLKMTEATLRHSQGYKRIWDCGKDVWEMRWEEIKDLSDSYQPAPDQFTE